MHGSNSEFDFGSEAAFAYHVNKRGLTGPGPESIKAEVVWKLVHNPNSRLARALRALFGDDLLDRWAQAAGWSDIFSHRPQPVEDHSIEGRVAALNQYRDEYGYSVLDQVGALGRWNLVDVSKLEMYDTRIAPGERAYSRINGDTLVLGVDGEARVLESQAGLVATTGVTQRRVLPLGRVDDQRPEVVMADEIEQFQRAQAERRARQVHVEITAGRDDESVAEDAWGDTEDEAVEIAKSKSGIIEIGDMTVLYDGTYDPTRTEGIEPPQPIHVQAWTLRGD